MQTNKDMNTELCNNET